MMRVLYKILPAAEWATFRASGAFSGSKVDRQDGFIHFSYADQLAETACKHFAGCGSLVLLAISPEGLGESLRDEPSRGGALFPHLYNTLLLESILWSREMRTDTQGLPVLGEIVALCTDPMPADALPGPVRGGLPR